MRREIRLIVALFLLVVGPAAVLCFLAGRILGNWHLILERRLESSAALMLDSTAFAADARINESLNGLSVRVSDWLAHPAGERTMARYAAGFSASNLWTQGIFVFSPDGALLYPRSPGTRPISPDDRAAGMGEDAPQTVAGGGNDADPEDLPGAPPGAAARTNLQVAIRESLAVLAQPGLAPLADCRIRLRLAQGYRAAGLVKDAIQLLGAAPSLAQAIDSEETREGDEGFLLDLAILKELARLCRATGDEARAARYDEKLLDRVLGNYDRLVPLQRELMLGYLRSHVTSPADSVNVRGKGGEYSPPDLDRLRAEWRERERAAALAPATAALLGQAAVQASAEAAGTGRTWAWTRVSDRSYLCSAAGASSSGVVCMAVDADGLEREIVKTAFRAGAELDLALRVYGPLRAARPAEAEPGKGTRLGSRRLGAPLDEVTIEAYPADPEALSANMRLQTRLYTWGGIVLAASVLAGAWFVWREALAEIREARDRSDFAAAVSHDLRTPLSSMRMLTESLYLGRIEDPDKRNKFLGIMLRECDRLGRLTDRALFFFRFGQGAMRYRLTEGDLGSLVRNAAETFGAAFREGELALSVGIPPGLPSVRFDAGALEQVVFNLLDNAVKYSKKAGVAARSAPSALAPIREPASSNSPQSLAPTAASPGGAISESPAPALPGVTRVEVSMTADAKRREVEIAVRDFGIGIPRNERQRIFRAYYRGRQSPASNASGVGLGLAVCYHIVRAHRGRMEVVSEPGEGATFRVILPSAL